MNLKQNLEVDIKQFFNNIESQNSNDQTETLRLLLDKYIHLTKAEFVMDKHDLEVIIGNAKSIMIEKTLPAHLGKNKRRVQENEQQALCIIESTIGHLNKNECLKKLPKFDYREDKL